MLLKLCRTSAACGTLSTLVAAMPAHAGPPDAEVAAGAAPPAASGPDTPAPAQTSPVTLQPVEVTGSTPPDGSAQAGYRVKTSTASGPVLGTTQLQDTPYAITVIPHQLIENIQAPSPDALIQMDPSAQLEVSAGRGFNVVPLIRGFSSQQLYDGTRDNGPFEDLEDKDRVEILNGLTGFLYGNSAGLPGGTLNYVLKRPTPTLFTDITSGTYGGGNLYSHLDTGGPIGDGRIGYRLNALIQNGYTAIDDQHVDRKLISGALDFHATDNLLIQFDAAYSYRKTTGIIAGWFSAPGAAYQAAPDASRDWGQPYTYWSNRQTHVGTDVTWTVNDALTLRGALRFAQRDSGDLFENDTFQTNGTISEGLFYSEAAPTNVYSGYGYADLKFATFGIAHKVTFGYSADRTDAYSPQTPFETLATVGMTIAQPARIPEPTAVNSAIRESSIATNENLTIVDNITLTPSWLLLLGLTDAHVMSENFAFTGNGAESGGYNKTALSPSVSLVYKPAPWVSTYFTYMKGLEQGGTANATNAGLPVTNAGSILAPVDDVEYEVGAKATVGSSLLTLALFDIRRASDVYLPNGTVSYTFAEDGLEEHRGVEFGITGKVTRTLTLWGGVTLMDAQIIDNPSSPSLVGTRPANVSNQLAKLYAEYSVDQLPGLTLTGGVIHAGNFYANPGNSDLLPGYTIFNLGARYETKLYGTPATIRFDADNITDRDYWLSSLYEGDPRSFLASVEVGF